MPSVPINEVLPNLNGCTIAHYQVLDLVGSGGYGMVYRVLDKRCSKQDPVYHAIKCMRKAKPETRQSTFQMRELALQKVVRDHPNIVTLHSVFSDDQHLYAIMDLCPGGDLFSAIVERRVYHRNNTLIKKAFCQLLDALQYCHARSIYHRDIKPENIMCTSDGANVYLADFGLATTTRVSEEFGCGSKYYMSPECINQEFGLETYSLPESDVWALGVILCNLISAQNPWRFATTDDERFAGYLQDPIFLRRMLRISHGANRILRRIFTLNPRDRISIPELREQILKLDSLFMHEQEAVEDADGSNLKTPKAEVSPCLPKIVINGSSVSRSSTVSPGSAGSGIFSLRANPSVANLPALIDHSSSKSSNAADPVIQDLRNVLLESGIQVGATQAAQRSASSGPSTGAPGTPAVYAVDPGVEVQELAEEEGLGGQRLVMEPNTPVKAKEGSRSSRFLKFAMKGLRRAS